MALTAVQLEAKVIAAVDAVLRGAPVEDDFVEFKRAWPGSDKARQLGGFANQAHGSPTLLLIGVDEKARTIVPLDGIDPATWWAEVSAQFDTGVAPDLARHLHVHIDPNQSVAGWFGLERATCLNWLDNPELGRDAVRALLLAVFDSSLAAIAPHDEQLRDVLDRLGPAPDPAP